MLLFPIRYILKAKKSKNIARTEEMRLKGYRNGTIEFWVGVAVVLIMVLIGSISLADIGFGRLSFNHNFWFTVITLSLSGIMLVYNLYLLISTLASKKVREKNKAELTEDKVADVIPRTKKEKRLYLLFIFSSAVSEEVVCRGFTVFLLQTVFPSIPIFLIILIPSMLFGIGHIWQGLEGVIECGLVGALFMCLFLVTGSLLLPIILHFICDLPTTFLLSEEPISA